MWKINSIYYAIDDPDRPRSHDRGIDVGSVSEPAKGRRGRILIDRGPAGLSRLLTAHVPTDG